MGADALISRLDRVKQTGAGRWLARCPAHADKSPSLSIRETPDGRTLLHCFSGCSVEEILAALGLTFDDLFPERAIDHHLKRERRPFNALDVLRAVADETLIVSVAAMRLGNGNEITPKDRERLLIAGARISAAKELADGQ